MWQRLARVVIATSVMAGLCAGCTGGGAVRLSAAPSPPTSIPSPPSVPTAMPTATPMSASVPPWASPTVLEQGDGTFSRVAGDGTPIEGVAGTLVTYCVLIEDGITSFTVEDFAAVVDRVLADHRGWTASRRWRFQRLPMCAVARLRVHLATPATTDRLCYPAASTEGQYSCRNGDNVYINLRRWTLGVPHYGDDLVSYRRMVVSHEVGHFLGFGHVPCPGAGRPAPVMQTQTIAMHGCLRNPYPYPDGVNYIG